MQSVARIVLGVDSQELAEEVVDFLDRSGRARVVASVGSADDLAAALLDHRPHAVVGTPALVRAAGGVNGSQFLALDTAESLASLRGALEAGARGFYLWPSERTALAEAAAGAAPPPERGPGREALVIAVHGPRGGAGATFVATHLALALAGRDLRVAVADLDPQYGDLTVALGVPAEPEPRTVADLQAVAHELSEEHLDEVLWRHPAGFDVLLAPPRTTTVEAVTGPVYRAAVPVLASNHDVVVLHLPRAIDATSVAALQVSGHVLVVLTLDVLAFRAVRRSVEVMRGIGVDDRVSLVVNRATRSELSPKDVARAFGRAPVAVIPADRRVAAAQDRGQLLRGRGGAMRPLRRLANRLTVGVRP